MIDLNNCTDFQLWRLPRLLHGAPTDRKSDCPMTVGDDFQGGAVAHVHSENCHSDLSDRYETNVIKLLHGIA